jgi:hypothetical protein
MTPADDSPVAPGWTVRDLNQLALFAAYRYWSRAADYDTRYAAAWSAAAEALCAAPEPPERTDVLRAAVMLFEVIAESPHIRPRPSAPKDCRRRAAFPLTPD